MLWIFGVAIICHALFSRLGFNPSDEGFTIAVGRRIVFEGEIPHVDFINVRPPLVFIYHSLFILAGEFAIYFSRFFFWLESASVAWLSALIFTHRQLPPVSVFLLAGIAFIFNVHDFPQIPWSVVEGVLLLLIGVHMVTSKPEKKTNVAAYFIMGLSYMFKQNFLFAVVAALLCFGGRRPANWVAAALPGIVYLAFYAIIGGLEELFFQMTWAGNLCSECDTGLVRVFKTTLWGKKYALLGGIVAAAALYQAGNKPRWKIPALVLAIPAVVFLGTDFHNGGFWRLINGSEAIFPFVAFAMCFTVSVILAVKRKFEQSRYFVFLFVLGWAICISTGYKTPFLILGTMMVALCVFFLRRANPRALNLLLAALIVLFSFVFVNWRKNNIYREVSSVSMINRSLDGVMPGAKMIKTNSNTYAAIADFKNLTDKMRAEGKTYATVPFFAAWWVRSEQKNPLPNDWPNIVELMGNDPRMIERFLGSMIKQKGSISIIWQKYDMERLATNPTPSYFHGFSNPRMLNSFLKKYFTKTYETEFYEVYE